MNIEKMNTKNMNTEKMNIEKMNEKMSSSSKSKTKTNAQARGEMSEKNKHDVQNIQKITPKFMAIFHSNSKIIKNKDKIFSKKGLKNISATVVCYFRYRETAKTIVAGTKYIGPAPYFKK